MKILTSHIKIPIGFRWGFLCEKQLYMKQHSSCIRELLLIIL